MKHLATKWIYLVGVITLILILWFVYQQVQQTSETVKYEVIYIEDAPAQIYSVYDRQKAEMGFSVNPYDHSQYILITAGTMKTGGYDLEINEVDKTNGKWIIKASLLPPEPDSFVTQAISYPSMVVQLPQAATRMEVIVDGKEYPELK